MEDLEKVTTENPEVLANLITYAEEMYDKDDATRKHLSKKHENYRKTHQFSELQVQVEQGKVH